MIEKNDPMLMAFSALDSPPLPKALEVRTAARARAHLPRGKKVSAPFIEFSPPAFVVPSLLVFAAIGFVIDSVPLIARIFSAF